MSNPKLIVYENVAFHKTNEVALSRSKWLSTFVLDLKPYEHFLSKLSGDLRKASIAPIQLINFMNLLSRL